MLSPDVDLADLDARHWAGWWDLLVPPQVLARPPWALVVLDGQVPVHVIVSGLGARAVPAGAPGALDPKGLAALAETLGVAAVLAIERRVLGELSRTIESSLAFDQDPLEQGLVALRAVKQYASRGIWTHPPLLDVVPAPAFEPIQRTFDRLVPDDTALLAYVLADDRTHVHASIIAVKQRGDITRIATHRSLADVIDETHFARAWGRDGGKAMKQLLSLVETRYAKPSIAIVLERAAWLRIMTGPTDQLARELDGKHVVIDPAPAWLLGLLGGAAVAAVASRAMSTLAGFLPRRTRDAASALAGRAKDAMMESGTHPFALLGFDPLELWARLRVFYASSGARPGPGRAPSRNAPPSSRS